MVFVLEYIPHSEVHSIGHVVIVVAFLHLPAEFPTIGGVHFSRHMPFINFCVAVHCVDPVVPVPAPHFPIVWFLTVPALHLQR